MSSPTRTIGRNRATYQSMNDDDSKMDASRLSKKSIPINNSNRGGGSGKKKHLFFRKSASGVRRSAREANTSDAGSTTSSSTFEDSFASFNVSTPQLVGFSCPFAAAAAHQSQIHQSAAATSRPPLPVGTNKLQRVCVVQNCEQHSARSLQQHHQHQVWGERSLGPIDVDSLEEQPADTRRRADYKGPVDLDTLETTTPYSRSFRHLETVQSGEMLFGDERLTVSTVSTDDSQPVDVDDFLDAILWAQDEHEVVLDETDICRGLAGYEAGFEPEVIANLSQEQQQGHWDEDVDDEDDEEEPNKYVAQYRSRLPPSSAHHKHTRSSASAPIPAGRKPPSSHHKQTRSLASPVPARRKQYSLPKSAAEV